MSDTYQNFVDPVRSMLHREDLSCIAPYEKVLRYISERMRRDGIELALYRKLSQNAPPAELIDTILKESFGVPTRAELED